MPPAAVFCAVLFFGCAQGPLAQGGEVGVDEAVQVAVHHGVYVAGLKAGAVVLHHGVGHEHIRPDLAAPR